MWETCSTNSENIGIETQDLLLGEILNISDIRIELDIDRWTEAYDFLKGVGDSEITVSRLLVHIESLEEELQQKSWLIELRMFLLTLKSPRFIKIVENTKANFPWAYNLVDIYSINTQYPWVLEDCNTWEFIAGLSETLQLERNNLRAEVELFILFYKSPEEYKKLLDWWNALWKEFSNIPKSTEFTWYIQTVIGFENIWVLIERKNRIEQLYGFDMQVTSVEDLLDINNLLDNEDYWVMINPSVVTLVSWFEKWFIEVDNPEYPRSWDWGEKMEFYFGQYVQIESKWLSVSDFIYLIGTFDYTSYELFLSVDFGGIENMLEFTDGLKNFNDKFSFLDVSAPVAWMRVHVAKFIFAYKQNWGIEKLEVINEHLRRHNITLVDLLLEDYEAKLLLIQLFDDLDIELSNEVLPSWSNELLVGWRKKSFEVMLSLIENWEIESFKTFLKELILSLPGIEIGGNIEHFYALYSFYKQDIGMLELVVLIEQKEIITWNEMGYPDEWSWWNKIRFYRDEFHAIQKKGISIWDLLYAVNKFGETAYMVFRYMSIKEIDDLVVFVDVLDDFNNSFPFLDFASRDYEAIRKKVSNFSRAYIEKDGIDKLRLINMNLQNHGINLVEISTEDYDKKVKLIEFFNHVWSSIRWEVIEGLTPGLTLWKKDSTDSLWNISEHWNLDTFTSFTWDILRRFPEVQLADNIKGLHQIWESFKSDPDLRQEVFSEDFYEFAQFLWDTFIFREAGNRMEPLARLPFPNIKSWLQIHSLYKNFPRKKMEQMVALLEEAWEKVVANDVFLLLWLSSHDDILTEAIEDTNKFTSVITQSVWEARTRTSFWESSMKDDSWYTERPDISEFSTQDIVRIYILVSQIQKSSFVSSLSKIVHSDLERTDTELGWVITLLDWDIALLEIEPDEVWDNGAYKSDTNDNFQGGIVNFHLHATKMNNHRHSWPSGSNPWWSVKLDRWWDLAWWIASDSPWVVFTTLWHPLTKNGKEDHTKLLMNIDYYFIDKRDPDNLKQVVYDLWVIEIPFQH